MNTCAKMNKWLTVGENFSFSGNTTHLVNEDDEWNAIMMEAIAIDPITKVIKEDGSWDGSKYNTIANPVAHLDRTKNESKDYSLGGDVFADVTFLKDFVFTSRFGYYQTFGNGYDWMPTFFVKTGEENSQTSVSRDYFEGVDWVSSNYLTWQHQYNKSNIKVMAGMEAERNYSEWFGVTATDLISEQLNLIYIDNATGNQDASAYGLASTVKYVSYFGRINYNLSDNTAPEPWASPDTTTVYSVFVEDSAGCQYQSGPVYTVNVIPVGIYQINNLNNIVTYPNPANNEIWVEYLMVPGNTPQAINIYTLDGKKIFSKPVNNNYGILQLDVSGIQAGNYIVKIGKYSKQITIVK
jgi:hypothetical protein